MSFETRIENLFKNVMDYNKEKLKEEKIILMISFSNYVVAGINGYNRQNTFYLRLFDENKQTTFNTDIKKFIKLSVTEIDDLENIWYEEIPTLFKVFSVYPVIKIIMNNEIKPTDSPTFNFIESKYKEILSIIRQNNIINADRAARKNTQVGPGITQVGPGSKAEKNALIAFQNAQSGSSTTKNIIWPRPGSKGKYALEFKSKSRKVWQKHGTDCVKVKVNGKFKYIKVSRSLN